MTGSGEAIFDWDVVNDEISGARRSRASSASDAVRSKGRPPAGSTSSIRSTATAIPLALDGLLHQRSGRINHDLRLRGSDGHYFWYRPEGAAGDRRRRRGRAGDRLVRGRHRNQVGRRAHAPRRDPRQSDRPSQPRAVPRPADLGALSRAEAGRAGAGGARRRHRPASRRQRFLRPVAGRRRPARPSLAAFRAI